MFYRTFQILTIITFVLGLSQAAPTQSEWTIGVLQDGSSKPREEFLDSIRAELSDILFDDVDVQWTIPEEYNANWNTDAAGDILERALEDDSIDIVLALGPAVTHAAAVREEGLPKPVVGGIIAEGRSIGLPMSEEGYSTLDNFNFVAARLQAEEDLRVFHRMIGFDVVHLLVESSVLESMQNLSARKRELEEELGIEVVVQPYADTGRDTLDFLDGDVEAVYLTPNMQLTREQMDALIVGINRRNIPTFAMFGRELVERGVLAARTALDLERLARRIALNLQGIMMGTPADELPVEMPLDEQLTINARTAREIGYYPTFEIMIEATLLQQEEVERERPLTLQQAMRIAMGNNVDIPIKAAEVQASFYNKKRPLTALFPQIEAQGDYLQIDSERARASFGNQPVRKTTAGFSVTQILFEDSIIQDFRSASRLYEGQQHEFEAVLLDTIDTSAKRFLNLLKARILVSVAQDNLALTRENLRLANLRYKVGTAGPEEVYRWEAQEAEQQRSLIDAYSQAEQARVALNQALGLNQNILWKPVDIPLGEEDYYFLGDRFFNLVRTEADLAALLAFSVEQALKNSPGLKALDKAVEAQEIAVRKAVRKYYLPSASARFTYNDIVDQDFTGAGFEDVVPGPGGQIPSMRDIDEEWSFGVGLSYPIFQGGARKVQVEKARADLVRLEETRIRARQLIEQRVQLAMYALRSSQPSIRLSRFAADRAQKNLDVIQEKYAEGTVSILDLLDAQNQAFLQQQSAAIAEQEYLTDLMEYQRAISWYEFEKTPEQQSEWLNKFEAFREERTLGKM